MPSIPDLLRLNRNQLKSLVEAKGAQRMRAIYEDARADLERKLQRLVKAGKGETFTAHHHRVVLIQLRDALNGLNENMVAELGKNVKTAAQLSNTHLIKTVKALEKRYTGVAPVLQVEQAAVFQNIYKGIKPSLLDRHKKSVSNYGKPLVEKIKLEMSQAMLQNEALPEVVERIAGLDGVFAENVWMAERIGRTEMAYAYGVTKQRAMEATVERDFPDMMKKWVANFDDRTGDDSKALHGKIIPVDEEFTYTYQTKKGAQTISCLQPPIRPNDRCEAIMWRPGWTELAATRPA